MHIVVVGINYTPEKIGIGRNTTELCEYLVSQGHAVSVITTFPHYPEWKTFKSYRGKLFMFEKIKEVSVYRVYSAVPRRPFSAIQRILHDITFALNIFLYGLTIRRIDVILTISPPLEAGLTSCALARLKRAKFALQIKDIVPDLAIKLGMLKNPLVIKLATHFERFIYRRAQAILVLCEGFANNLKSKGVAEEKISLITDWVDTTHIRPLARNNYFRRNHKIDGKFLALYAGTMGFKQKLENVIDAAKCLSDVENILFLLVGSGPRKEYLEKRASGLRNIRFMPLQPQEAVPYMFASADVLLLNQSADVLDMVIPYKLLNYMAAARPIIASAHAASEAAEYVCRAKCGFTVPPEKPQALADAVRRIYADRKTVSNFGENGRIFIESHFSQEKVLKRYLDFFDAFNLKDIAGGKAKREGR